jgi:uncharacterized membrane protein YhaH (DUF805 family)
MQLINPHIASRQTHNEEILSTFQTATQQSRDYIPVTVYTVWFYEQDFAGSKISRWPRGGESYRCGEQPGKKIQFHHATCGLTGGRELVKKFLQNLISTEGRLSRIGFLHSFIVMLCLLILLSILNREYIRSIDGELTVYLYVSSLQSVLLLALWTPSIIKRLHDLDIKGNRAWLGWAALFLDVHNLMLLNVDAVSLLQALQPLLFIFYAVVVFFYLILFLMPGSTGVNNWGQVQE